MDFDHLSNSYNSDEASESIYYGMVVLDSYGSSSSGSDLVVTDYIGFNLDESASPMADS